MPDRFKANDPPHGDIVTFDDESDRWVDEWSVTLESSDGNTTWGCFMSDDDVRRLQRWLHRQRRRRRLERVLLALSHNDDHATARYTRRT